MKLSIDAQVLATCKRFTGEEIQIPLAGVNFSSDPTTGLFTIQSSNGHVVARYQSPIVMPYFSLMADVTGLKLPKKGDIELEFGSNEIRIGNKVLQAKSDIFPQKALLWQPKIEPSAEVSLKALKNQVEIALAYSKEMVLHLCTTDNTVKLMSECDSGALFVEMPATVYKSGQVISIAASYLKQALMSSKSKNVKLDLGCIWEDDKKMLGVIDTTSVFILKVECKSRPVLQGVSR